MEESESEPNQNLAILPPANPRGVSATLASSIVVPAIIGDAGDRAAKRFLEFFAATIRNKNTRTAYYRACVRFFDWCDAHHIGQLADIEPLHVAAYIEALGKDFKTETVKLA